MTRDEIANKIRWSRIIWFFGLVNVIAMLPQLVRLVSTRETQGLALEMFVIYGLVQMALSLEGYFKRNRMLMVCFGLSTAISTTIIGLILFFRSGGVA